MSKSKSFWFSITLLGMAIVSGISWVLFKFDESPFTFPMALLFAMNYIMKYEKKEGVAKVVIYGLFICIISLMSFLVIRHLSSTDTIQMISPILDITIIFLVVIIFLDYAHSED